MFFIASFPLSLPLPCSLSFSVYVGSSSSQVAPRALGVFHSCLSFRQFLRFCGAKPFLKMCPIYKYCSSLFLPAWASNTHQSIHPGYTVVIDYETTENPNYASAVMVRRDFLYPGLVEKGVSRYKALKQLTSLMKYCQSVYYVPGRESTSQDRLLLSISYWIILLDQAGRHTRSYVGRAEIFWRLHEQVPQHALTLGKRPIFAAILFLVVLFWAEASSERWLYYRE